MFASTNIDDIFLLAAFFADPQLRHRSIVIGQYLGIGALVLVSTLAALLALALPAGWAALLGVVPLFLGLSKLIRRYGNLALPIVLIALGIYILSGALVLLR